MSSFNTDCKIFKEFKGELQVDGMNIYTPEVVQFRLYSDPNTTDGYLFYVFPITAGMALFGDYFVLNQKDCVAVITKGDIEDMFKGIFTRSITADIYNN